MDINQIIKYIVEIIGGATIIFRALLGLSKLTETKEDDKFFKRALKFLTLLSGFIALDSSKEKE